MTDSYTTDNIAFTPGLLSVTDCHGNETLITELPMSAYEQFYKLWSLAFAQAANDPESSFQELWVFNQVFRNNLERALELLGIKAADYSPRVIKELLMVAGNGGSGLIFQLHQEMQPDVKKLRTLKDQPPDPPKQPTATKKPGFLKGLTDSIKAAGYALDCWVMQGWQTVGL